MVEERLTGREESATPPEAPQQASEPECALVPAGEFLMGSEQGQDDERPAHRVWVDASEMAVFQVRNQDFARFLEAPGHPAPPRWNDPDFNTPDQPVVAVNWLEATTYCDR